MTTFESSRPQDKVLILKRIPIFTSCTPEQLQLVADRTRLVEYKKGEHVYKQGDVADAFYIVSSGRLRVLSQVDGQEKTFTILHNGDSFGEISLLTGETHSVTVQALNDTLVLRLDKTEFDDVINRVPSFVLYLSRQLSRRLRTKEHGAGLTETTIIAVYSAAKGVGRTSFAVALAAALRRETTHGVVIVDLSGADGKQGLLYGSGGPLPTRSYTLQELASGEPFQAALSAHPLGFSVLFASTLREESAGEHLIAPLLNSLSNVFSYIVMDLPVMVDPIVLKALVQADLIYLMTDPRREHVIRTTALVHELRASVGAADQRMKVVLNLMEGTGQRIRGEEVAQHIGLPIAVTLPHLEAPVGSLTVEELSRLLESRASPYAASVRHVARELGGLLVGLALGSGAALGLAHIGVLKVIEREKVPIDIIAGSSIGALIAGLWASGRSAEELERMALRFKNPWDIRRLFMLDFSLPIVSVITGAIAGLLVGWLAGFWAGLLFGFIVTVGFGMILGPLAGGPIQGARLMAQLKQDFAGKTFEETWLPLKIIAANPQAREEVVFESGPLADAVRASVSIPGIFKPVMFRGRLCLDGGVVSPVPVSVLKRAGTHHVIAVNVFPTTAELTRHLEQLQRRRAEREAQLASRHFVARLLAWLRQELVRSNAPIVFDIIMRSMQSMEYQIAEVACREADLTLRPTVPGSHWLEFFNPEQFIRRGEEVALEHLQELKRLTRRNVDNP